MGTTMGMMHAALDRYDVMSMSNLAEYIQNLESEMFNTEHFVMLDGDKVYALLQDTYTVCEKSHGTMVPLEDVLDHLGINGDQETTEDITGCDFTLWQSIIALFVERLQNERSDIFALVYG
jgi:hypothetical protein